MLRMILKAALATAMLLAASAAPADGSEPPPRVVVIVGPAGAATDRYRAEARAAADLAQRSTPDVIELYSPHATWPAVRRALQGASVVVYMGHGNGWPSRYRDALFGATQNGFGLNATDGPRDDHTHRYVGEDPIAREIRLAPGAVVLLHHLCYASGLSEPGLPEGTLSEARQRIDNFAAGFIRAGASAVVAEAYGRPDHMLAAILDPRRGAERAIETAWRAAPTANGNVTAFQSRRSPGFVALMDPASRTAGFERSLVLRSGLTSADVRAGADPEALPPPSLVGTGVAFAAPVLRGTSVAGRPSRIRITTSTGAADRLPRGMGASVRWTPLDPESSGADLSGADLAGADAASTGMADADLADAVVPDLGLVVAERPGEVGPAVPVGLAAMAIGFDVTMPALPGRYRLDVTLLDPSGVAYDTATQAAVPALLVQVTGALDAALVLEGEADLTAGAAATLPVHVTNLGDGPWGALPGDRRRQLGGGLPATAARVLGRWLPAGEGSPGQADAAAAAAAGGDLPPAQAPGSTERIELALVVPTVPGPYLLVLDIVMPDGGSLVGAGRRPFVVPVAVEEVEGTGPRQ